jgi:hypothetical protein
MPPYASSAMTRLMGHRSDPAEVPPAASSTSCPVRMRDNRKSVRSTAMCSLRHWRRLFVPGLSVRYWLPCTPEARCHPAPHPADPQATALLGATRITLRPPTHRVWSGTRGGNSISVSTELIKPSAARKGILYAVRRSGTPRWPDSNTPPARPVRCAETPPTAPTHRASPTRSGYPRLNPASYSAQFRIGNGCFGILCRRSARCLNGIAPIR